MYTRTTDNELCIQLLEEDSDVFCGGRGEGGEDKETVFVVFKYQRFLVDWGKSSVEALLSKVQIKQPKYR